MTLTTPAVSDSLRRCSCTTHQRVLLSPLAPTQGVGYTGQCNAPLPPAPGTHVVVACLQKPQPERNSLLTAAHVHMHRGASFTLKLPPTSLLTSHLHTTRACSPLIALPPPPPHPRCASLSHPHLAPPSLRRPSPASRPPALRPARPCAPRAPWQCTAPPLTRRDALRGRSAP